MRPEMGTQAQFRKKKPAATYRYDSSLSPALEWDGKNSAREQGEALKATHDESVWDLLAWGTSAPVRGGQAQPDGSHAHHDRRKELVVARDM